MSLLGHITMIELLLEERRQEMAACEAAAAAIERARHVGIEAQNAVDNGPEGEEY